MTTLSERLVCRVRCSKTWQFATEPATESFLAKYGLAKYGHRNVVALRIAAIAWLLTCILVTCGCDRRPVSTLQMLSGQTMGTSYSIKLLPIAGGPELGTVLEQVELELQSVNDQMSTYIETSELSRFNESRSTDWMDVSLETAEVVQLALEVNRLTDGAFDVTVGPLVDAWGFGPKRLPESLPTEEQIADLLLSVGSDKLEARLSPPALRKSIPGLRVDLSAIAKGHGVDRLARVLDELGFNHYYIEIGGEVRTRGARSDGKPWRVGVEKPVEGERGLHSVVGLSDRSLATSGDYRNFYREQDKRYTHFIDPKTGRPSESDMASASVIAENCALADGLATGLMAAGSERGMELAKAHGWSVMLIAHRDEALEVLATESFESLLTEMPAQTHPLQTGKAQ